MIRWAPHLYREEGLRRGVPENIIESALTQARRLENVGLPPVLTLGHLAFHTEVPYNYLREVISRKIDPYRTFSIRKRSGGKRYINVPDSRLLKVQKWIDRFILSNVKDSPYSYAFKRGFSIVDCAQQHLGCTWLIKIDLRHFFESLSEIQVYHVFVDLGYSKLIAFEMARLCTKVLQPYARKYQKRRWRSWTSKNLPISDYRDEYNRIGHLPQGVPTSPKLANLIVRDLDIEIAALANKFGLIYTRYADDMIFSTARKDFNRKLAKTFICYVYKILPKYGLRPHPQKAQIIPPGSRKIVLGLLVDRNKVRLTKQFRYRLECHLYYCAKDPVTHAKIRGFNSILGLKNYVNGLLAYARQVDPEYVEKILKKYGTPIWPI